MRSSRLALVIVLASGQITACSPSNSPGDGGCNLGHCGCTVASDCPAGDSCCAQGCVDLQTEPTNCGLCGHACTKGQTCSAGHCVCASNANCGTSETCCNGGCVDTSGDPANCGGCGNLCPMGQICVGGACVCTTDLECSEGESCCDGACIDTQTDENCGGCGVVCPTNESCVSGQCTCPSSQVCSGATMCCGPDQFCCGSTCLSNTFVGTAQMSVSVNSISGESTCTANVTWQRQEGGVFQPQGTAGGEAEFSACTPTVGPIQPADATLTVDCSQTPPSFSLTGGANPTSWPAMCETEQVTATCMWLPPASEGGSVTANGVIKGNGGPVILPCIDLKIGATECTFTNSFCFGSAPCGP